MKRFMYLSIGVLALMLAALTGFHMGNRAAHAQATDPVPGYRVVYDIDTHHYVMGWFSQFEVASTAAVVLVTVGEGLAIGAGCLLLPENPYALV